MMLSRVQHCWSSLHNQEMIPTYSFVSFIRSGHLLLLLITFFLQQSRALSQLQTESSSTTTYSDLLPSYIFLQSSFSPTSDINNNPMTTRSSEERTSSYHTSIEISDDNFNDVTFQKNSLTKDSSSFLSMTSAPNSLGFHHQLSSSGCFGSNCRFEPSSSFTNFGTAIPIPRRQASSQFTPDSSSILGISGSPLPSPTSAIKTSSPSFIIMADAITTTMASQQRLKKKRNKKRRRKKRKKKRKKKKSKRKGRRTTMEWEGEVKREITQASTTEMKDWMKRVAISHSAPLKSVSFLAPIQRNVPLFSFSPGIISQPMSLKEVTGNPFQTIKSTPVFKASSFSTKQTITFPTLVSNRLLQKHLIKSHPPTTTVSLTIQNSYYELNKVPQHSDSFVYPSLSKNQIPIPITNLDTPESISIHNNDTTPYFMPKSSESKPVSQELNTLSSSFSFIHKSDFPELQSSLVPLNTQLETSFSSLKDFPDKDNILRTIIPTMSSNIEPHQSQSFPQIKISAYPTPSEQSSVLNSPINQTAYMNPANSVNSTKYTILESILLFQARHPPIIEKSLEIDEHSRFQSLPQIYSSNSFLESELSQNIFNTFSNKLVSKTQFPSSLNTLSVNDVTNNLNIMNILTYIDTVLNYINASDSVSAELPSLSSSTYVSPTSVLSSSNPVIPLWFQSQINAKHERTKKSVNTKQSLFSRKIAPNKQLLNKFEQFRQISLQSNSVDQSFHPSFLSDFVSNLVPSSRLSSQFTKESIEVKLSSFVDSVHPTTTFPKDFFSDFALTNSSQPLSWSDIHSTFPFNDFLPLQTSSSLTFDSDLTHTSLSAGFISQSPINQNTPQAINRFGDEKNFNLTFGSQKRQNLKYSLNIMPSKTDIAASNITNNLILNDSFLSLEQKSRTSSMMFSYSQENIFSDDFPLLPTMIPDQEPSYNSVDILSSSFLQVLSSELVSAETSLWKATPKMTSYFMPLETLMPSLSSGNKLQLSVLESYSQSLNSVLITGSSNMTSSTDDSTNTLLSTPELSNLFFPPAGVNPDVQALLDLSGMDSKAFTTDSDSQLRALINSDVSMTANQLTSSEYENENDLLRPELSVSKNHFTEHQKFSSKKTLIESPLAFDDFHSQSKLSDSTWTADSNTVEDDLLFSSYLISGLISPSDSESVDTLSVQLSPSMSSEFILKSLSTSLIWSLTSSSLPQQLADAKATNDPTLFGSMETVSSNPFDYSSSMDLNSESWDSPFSEQFLESTQSLLQISSHFKLLSQLLNKSLSKSQTQKSSQFTSDQSTLLTNLSSYLESSRVKSSQTMLLLMLSQESFHNQSSQLMSQISQSLLLEPSEQITYWLDSSSIASQIFSSFQTSHLTSSVMIEQSKLTSELLFEAELSEWTSQLQSSQVSQSLFQRDSLSMVDSTLIQMQSEDLLSLSQLLSQLETLQPTSQSNLISPTSQLSSAFPFPIKPLHLSSVFTSQMSSQLIPTTSSQFTSKMTSKLISTHSSKFTSQMSSQHIPMLSSQFTSKMTPKFAFQMSSEFIPISSKFPSKISLQLTSTPSSQFTSKMTSKFTSQISSQLIPTPSSQFTTQIMSQLILTTSSPFTSNISSKFTSQMSSQFIPTSSSKFTSKMTSQFISQISSQLIPTPTSKFISKISSQFIPPPSSQFSSEMSSQFTSQISSQLIPTPTSKFISKMSSQFIPPSSSQFSSEMTSQFISQISSQLVPTPSSKFVSKMSSQFIPPSSSQFSSEMTSQFTSQISSQLIPTPSSKFISKMSSQFIPPSSSQFSSEMSSQFTSQISSQLIPTPTSKFISKMSSQFISLPPSQFSSEMTSQFISQISSQLIPTPSSKFISKISSQFIPSLQFSSEMSSQFTSQISSQLIPTLSSQFTIQRSKLFQLTSQLDSSPLVLNFSVKSETLQLASSQGSLQTEFPHQTLQLSSELKSLHLKSQFHSLQSGSKSTFQIQSLPLTLQSSLQSDLSHQASQFSSYSTDSSLSLLHQSLFSSQQTSQSIPWFSSELDMTHSTKLSSKFETLYLISELTSPTMSSLSQSQLYSTFALTLHPISTKLNSSWFKLETQSTLKTEMNSISSFVSTLMPTFSVTKTLSHEINTTSLFYSTTKLANHSISDVDKCTNPIITLDITLPPTSSDPKLNLSQAFQNYWVITVIKVHLDINISAVAFRSEMEHNLARAYVEAYQRGEHILNGTYQPLRKKRFALVKDVALQMINITRSQTTSSNNVTLVYYMEKRGKPVPAISAVRHLLLLQPQELAIYLKHVVVLSAETYLKLPNPEPSKDWIIGAVLGTLLSALFLIWCILFIYFKCFRMRPAKSTHSKSATPQLMFSTSMQDINTDTSETTLIREEKQIERQSSLLKKKGIKKQTYSVALQKIGRKSNKEFGRREGSVKDVGKKKVKSVKKTVNGKTGKNTEMQPDAEINVVNDCQKQNGCVVMEQNEYLKENDNYSDYEIEPPRVQMLPPLSINDCTSNERLSPFYYVNLPPIQHNFSLTASRQEADDELRHQADHLRRIQKQRLKEERRKMRHVELYQNSPHYFLNHGQDMEVESNLRKDIVDECYPEESRRGSRRRRYKRREKHDLSSQEDSSLNDAYDEGEETWANQPETLQKTREKMHKLLDDAFQLIAKHERKKISPAITSVNSGYTRRSSIVKRRTRRQRTNLLETPPVSCYRKSSPSDSAPEEKLDRLHTPLFLHKRYSPCNHHRVNPAIPPPWNAAGDEAAKIAAEHQAWSSPYVSPRLNRSKILNSSDPREEMCLPTIRYPSDHNLVDFGYQPSFSFNRTRLSSQLSPYASSRQVFNNRHSEYHSVDNSDGMPTSLFQPTASYYPSNIENNIELNTFEPPSFAKHLSRSPGSSKTSPIDDEIDAIHKNVEQGSSPQPLIQSIREELMRLSNEKGERNSLRSRIVLD